jgi:hypothetical protein
VQSFQLWMPAVLSLFGALIVVVLTAWLNTRAVLGQIEAVRGEMNALRGEMNGRIGELNGRIDALRAEMKQGFAELRLEV